jgi:galactitol-specific phosphotransferase system IIB component
MKAALSIACLAVILSACGADVATATVTAAKLKAEEARQRQAQMEKMQKALDEVQRLNQQRMEAVENADGGS